MSVDIIPEGQTIDPLKIAFEKLMKVFIFLRDRSKTGITDADKTAFDDQMGEVGDVLDQLGGWACDSAQLDAKYPDDKYVAMDKDWRKDAGIL